MPQQAADVEDAARVQDELRSNAAQALAPQLKQEQQAVNQQEVQTDQLQAVGQTPPPQDRLSPMQQGQNELREPLQRARQPPVPLRPQGASALRTGEAAMQQQAVPPVMDQSRTAQRPAEELPEEVEQGAEMFEQNAEQPRYEQQLMRQPPA